jgi:hypothetical protein
MNESSQGGLELWIISSGVGFASSSEKMSNGRIKAAREPNQHLLQLLILGM